MKSFHHAMTLQWHLPNFITYPVFVSNKRVILLNQRLLDISTTFFSFCVRHYYHTWLIDSRKTPRFRAYQENYHQRFLQRTLKNEKSKNWLSLIYDEFAKSISMYLLIDFKLCFFFSQINLNTITVTHLKSVK